MKIIGLQAENIKRIKAISIVPTGSLVEITGKNDNGKTSILDAIYWAMAGKRAIQTKPIRAGQETARIRLDLGELIVTRTFKRKDDGDYTTEIFVESPDGGQYKSPQQMLDALIGALTFDPVSFTTKTPREQFDELRKFVPGVDFDAMQRKHDGLLSKRTDVNRDLKSKKAQAAAVVVPETIPDPIDESALTAELEKAAEHNQGVERSKSALVKLETEKKGFLDRANGFQEHAEQLRAQANEAEKRASEHRKAAQEIIAQIDAFGTVPEPVSTSEIAAKMQAARDHNATAAEARRKLDARATLDAEVAALQTKADDLTAQIDALAVEKETAIKGAKLPLPALSFGDGVVLLAGQPFDQASSAQQLRASIAIAAALNPELRVIRVQKGGNDLDSEAMQMVREFAEAADMQIWIERVDTTSPLGFVIEDGMVARQPEAAS